MSDNGWTPHILVQVDATVSVPHEYVKNNEVVLNVSADATGGLTLGNDLIRFQARFAGRVREITVPVNRVISIFARENGQGMVFESFAEQEPDKNDSENTRNTTESNIAMDAASTGLTLVNKPESPWKNNAATDPASNVQVQVLDKDHNVININTDDATKQLARAETVSGTTPANLQYYLQYYSQAGGASAGAVAATANFQLTYE